MYITWVALTLSVRLVLRLPFMGGGKSLLCGQLRDQQLKIREGWRIQVGGQGGKLGRCVEGVCVVWLAVAVVVSAGGGRRTQNHAPPLHHYTSCVFLPTSHTTQSS